MPSLEWTFKSLLYDVRNFSLNASGIELRPYQAQVAAAIVRSIIEELGHSFVIVFPRQSGKNECQAQIEAFLLTLFSPTPAQIIKVSPTFKPQTLNSMYRLQSILEGNLMAQDFWSKEGSNGYRVGDARITFLSGHSESHVVGATASLLLECDEAQDVPIAKWDKDFAPMAASTNATCVFYGTAWTSRTLLAREYRRALQAQEADGCRRVFHLTAGDVATVVPTYGKFVEEQVSKLGRDHPIIKTQYYSEEIDADTGLFPAARLALMRGNHLPQDHPTPGGIYAITLDVAGEDEALSDGDPAVTALKNAGRDSTALSVFSVDLSTIEDELIHAPTYRLVQRREWVGVKHTQLYAQIKALVEHWGARYLVVDATGVGAGLASFLDKTFPGAVIPFIFTQKSKSDLAWRFLAVIETGRYKEFDPLSAGSLKGSAELSSQVRLQEIFLAQAQLCQSVVLEGPGKLMRWGVPDGTRNPASGDLLHDDLLISAALCSVLDTRPWGIGRSQVIQGTDPLADLYDVY